MDEMRDNKGNGGFLRLKQVLELIPVSKTYWYEGIQRGIFPAPIKMGKVAFYRQADIEEILAKIENGDLEEADNAPSGPSM